MDTTITSSVLFGNTENAGKKEVLYQVSAYIGPLMASLYLPKKCGYAWHTVLHCQNEHLNTMPEPRYGTK